VIEMSVDFSIFLGRNGTFRSENHPDCGCWMGLHDEWGKTTDLGLLGTRVTFHCCPLHAAAPEMLAMLERMVGTVDGKKYPSPYQRDQIVILIEKAQDLIRRAKTEG
jgi:hypothetical protein